MQPAKERIQGYLDTLSTYGVDSANCYWTPTTEAFKELCELALKSFAPPEERATPDITAMDRARHLWHRQCGLDGSPCPTARECEAFNLGFKAAALVSAVSPQKTP